MRENEMFDVIQSIRISRNLTIKEFSDRLEKVFTQCENQLPKHETVPQVSQMFRDAVSAVTTEMLSE